MKDGRVWPPSRSFWRRRSPPWWLGPARTDWATGRVRLSRINPQVEGGEADEPGGRGGWGFGAFGSRYASGGGGAVGFVRILRFGLRLALRRMPTGESTKPVGIPAVAREEIIWTRGDAALAAALRELERSRLSVEGTLCREFGTFVEPVESPEAEAISAQTAQEWTVVDQAPRQNSIESRQQRPFAGADTHASCRTASFGGASKQRLPRWASRQRRSARQRFNRMAQAPE